MPAVWSHFAKTATSFGNCFSVRISLSSPATQYSQWSTDAAVLDVAGVSDRLPAATPAAKPIGPATSNPATPTAAVAA